MQTWEVIKYLMENKDSGKVFISEQNDRIYNIYLDDYTKEFFIDEKIKGADGWIQIFVLSSLELNKILYIDNWKCYKLHKNNK